MLRLTRKAGYGLIALKYMAEHSDEASLRTRNIAEAHHIPPQLLAKSLQQLAKAGILRSHAGTSGGYSLQKPPQQISAFEVIFAIDGPLFITSCGSSGTGCNLTPRCTIKEPLARVSDSISDLLRGITIADLSAPPEDTPRSRLAGDSQSGSRSIPQSTPAPAV
ncbi:MAG: RrF2 family transcriptional regulator [Terracidiphilus sp.]